jgi:hypothetical protein
MTAGRPAAIFASMAAANPRRQLLQRQLGAALDELFRLAGQNALKNVSHGLAFNKWIKGVTA